MTDRLKDDEKLALALYFQDTPEGEAAMELLRSRLTAEREARVKAEQELAAARERKRLVNDGLQMLRKNTWAREVVDALLPTPPTGEKP